MELWQIPMILGIGLVAGFFNTLAGGGSILTLPLLIFLGLPPVVANGTNRIGILFTNVNALYVFSKKGIRDFKMAILLTGPAVLGSLLGAQIALEIHDNLFNKILAFVVLIVAGVICFRRPAKQPIDLPLKEKSIEQEVGNGKKALLMFIFFLLGIFGGFIQAGTALFMIFALNLLTEYELIRILFIKVFVILVYTIFVLATFVWAGKISWMIGLTLALGMSAGAWIGAHLGIKKGERWIRIILVVAGVGMAIKLVV